MRIETLLFFALVPFTTMSAQTVAGRVVVKPGRIPLRRAVVELMIDSAGKWVDSTTADGTGVFYLNAPREGLYFVQIRTSASPDVFVSSPALSLAAHEDIQREFVVPLAMLILSESETETPARSIENSPKPKYPRELEKFKMEGSVLAQFVVDTTGRVVPGSFKVLRSQHPAFSDAVSDVVFRMIFEPARIGGQPVRQLVQQKFEFAFDRRVYPSP